MCKTNSMKFLQYLFSLTFYHEHDMTWELEYLFESVIEWLVWFGGFYGISTFVGYLTPNPFLCK